MVWNFNKLYCSDKVKTDIQEKYFSKDEKGKFFLDLKKVFESDGTHGEWGCKGQPLETEIDEDGIFFATNGFPCDELYSQLSKLYPNHKLVFKFAFEHPNDGVGMMIFDEGKRTHEEWYEENSPEEKNVYMELTGNSEEEYYSMGGYKPVSKNKQIKTFVNGLKEFDDKKLIDCYFNALRYYYFGSFVNRGEQNEILKEYKKEYLRRIEPNVCKQQYLEIHNFIIKDIMYPLSELSILDKTFMKGNLTKNEYNKLTKGMKDLDKCKDSLNDILNKYSINQKNNGMEVD